MQRYLYAALLCGSLFGGVFGLGSVDAKTIRVPGDFPTINGGLTSADYGDTVLVSPGRFPDPEATARATLEPFVRR